MFVRCFTHNSAQNSEYQKCENEQVNVAYSFFS